MSLKRLASTATAVGIAVSVSIFTCIARSSISIRAFAGEDSNRSESAIGRNVPAMSLKDARGETRSIGDLCGARATAIVFVSTECPMSNGYLEPLAELAREYRDRGVRVVLVNSNEAESGEQVAAHAAEFKIELPVLKDADHKLANAVGARVTPEAFVLDTDRVVRYVGRIDDQYVARLKRRDRKTTDDVRRSLDELLAGKPVSRPETEAFGCAIARTAAAKPAVAAVTFNRDVMPIIQKQCQDCHRPGAAAPFALMNYRQAAKWASDIERVVADRAMPPWKPKHGFGEFRDERRLSDDEIRTIAAWVDAGLPEGDAADLPPPREFAAGGWRLGEPDLVLTMTDEYEIYASGRDIIRHFVIPSGTTEDHWVTAVEFRPGNERVAHHAIFFTDTTGRARKLDDVDTEPGFSGFFFATGGIGGWAVGTLATPLPDGVGMKLPKGADIVMQMHYHPTGKPEIDRSTIGVYFAKSPVKKQAAAIPVMGMRFQWPAGDDHITATGKFTIPVATQAINVFPHMHLLGKSMKMTATLPDGTVQPLVDIENWDFAWQQAYFYKDPVPLPVGTVIDLEATFDNSSKNPANPNNPPKTVLFGEQTTNEMCFGFVGVTVDDESQLRELFRVSRPRQQAAQRK